MTLQKLAASIFLSVIACAGCTTQTERTQNLDLIQADAALNGQRLLEAIAHAYAGDDTKLRALTANDFQYLTIISLPGEVYFSHIADFIAEHGPFEIEPAELSVDGDKMTVTRRIAANRPDKSGEKNQWRLTEQFQRRDNQIISVAATLEMTSPGPTGPSGHAGPANLNYDPVKSTTLATYEPGVFLEGVATGPDNAIYTTPLFTDEIWKVTDAGETSVAFRLPISADRKARHGVVCIDSGPDGAFYVTVGGDASQRGVWRVPLNGEAPSLVAKLPTFTQPNGIDIDDAGRIWIADSFGAIWKANIDQRNEDAQLWLRSRELRVRPFVGFGPGANGVRYYDGALFVTVSDRASILRIGVNPDGAPGESETFFTSIGGDDLAVSASGVLYVTTHPANTVVAINPDGSAKIIAGVKENVVGAAAAAVRGRGENGSELIVVGDGGLFAPVKNRPITPSVVLLDLDQDAH